MQRVVLLGLFLCGCADTHPLYYHANHICLAPVQPDGMRRRRPSAKDLDTVSSLIRIPETERIIYWFEAPDGRIELGISKDRELQPGSTARKVKLIRDGSSFRVVDAGDDGIESLCIS